MSLGPSINLGPLTTTFTPPSDCFRPTAILSGTYLYAVEAFTGVPGNHNSVVTSCFPPKYTTNYNAAYYSPGICPSGLRQVNTTVSAGETSAWCCPPGLSYSGGSCALRTSTSATFNYYWNGTTTAVITGDFTLTTDAVTIWAPGLNIRYKAADFSTTSTTTTSRSRTSTSSSSTTTSGTTSGTGGTGTSIPVPDNSGGLSTGAKIGIGVGVPLAVLAVVGVLAAILLRRRSKKKQVSPTGVVPPQPNQYNNTGFNGQPMAPQMGAAPAVAGAHYPSTYPPDQQQQFKPPELYAPVPGSYGYPQQPGINNTSPPLNQPVELHSATPVAPLNHHELDSGANAAGAGTAPVTAESFPQYVQTTGRNPHLSHGSLGPVPDFLPTEPNQSTGGAPRT